MSRHAHTWLLAACLLGAVTGLGGRGERRTGDPGGSGRETVTHVANIDKSYVAYTLVLEQPAERQAALKDDTE